MTTVEFQIQISLNTKYTLFHKQQDQSSRGEVTVSSHVGH